MNTVGIICEYNPFHLGHERQFRLIRERYGQGSAIVCLMSGHYVQRGHPAIFDKTLRAAAAVESGANLVLELPTEYALSSAEGFASGGVRILSEICDTISFGTESMSASDLMHTADILLSDPYKSSLKKALSTGCSFPKARQIALEECHAAVPVNPNDILALEYCRAILLQQSHLHIMPVFRDNNYHSASKDFAYPSATAVREIICRGDAFSSIVPPKAVSLFADAARHQWSNAEKAILYRLRTMSDADFEALPFGSEGLWRRFMHAARRGNSTKEIAETTKSKRYTRSRIDRMMMCAFLGLTEMQMNSKPPYVRVLALDSRGGRLLRQHKGGIPLINTGSRTNEPYSVLEYTRADLYTLFSEGADSPESEQHRRVYIGEL